MKCQTNFLGEKERAIVVLSSAQSAKRVFKVKDTNRLLRLSSVLLKMTVVV